MSSALCFAGLLQMIWESVLRSVVRLREDRDLKEADGRESQNYPAWLLGPCCLLRG